MLLTLPVVQLFVMTSSDDFCSLGVLACIFIRKSDKKNSKSYTLIIVIVTTQLQTYLHSSYNNAPECRVRLKLSKLKNILSIEHSYVFNYFYIFCYKIKCTPYYILNTISMLLVFFNFGTSIFGLDTALYVVYLEVVLH